LTNTILIIENSPVLMEINREAFTRQGYRVIEAETISQGRALFKREQPDLIVMETKLPDGSGLCFCRELRNHSKIPILFVSIQGTPQDEIAGFSAGCSDYVAKPYSINVLIARVGGLLRFEQRITGSLSKNRITHKKEMQG